jgi:hypothetical protein
MPSLSPRPLVRPRDVAPALALALLLPLGCGSEVGGGGGGAGGGANPDNPPECQGGPVADWASWISEESDIASWPCTVDSAGDVDGVLTIALTCDEAAGGFTAELTFETEPAPTLPILVAAGDEIVVETFGSNDPPFLPTRVLRRAADDALLAAFVQGFHADPDGAPEGWLAPLTITEVDGLCSPVDGREPRALEVATADAGPLRVFSEHVGILDSSAGRFELRVTNTSYNPDVEGGCNRCVTYAVIGEPAP